MLEQDILHAVRRRMWNVVHGVLSDPSRLAAAAADLEQTTGRIMATLDERRASGLDDAELADAVRLVRATVERCARDGIGRTGAGELADAYRRLSATLERRLPGTERSR